MGLDITAYARIKPHRDYVDGEDLPSYLEHFRVNDEWNRAPEIDGSKVYLFDVQMGFSAGSYGGYNDWRDALARLAGYPPVDDPDTARRYAPGAWQAPEGPFWELINFTDCDGTIGAAVAAKLAKDFAEFDDRAKAAVTPCNWFYEVYQDFRAAFEMAARNGAVVFH